MQIYGTFGSLLAFWSDLEISFICRRVFKLVSVMKFKIDKKTDFKFKSNKNLSINRSILTPELRKSYITLSFSKRSVLDF